MPKASLRHSSDHTSPGTVSPPPGRVAGGFCGIDSDRGTGYLTVSKNLRVTGTRLAGQGRDSHMAESSYSVIEKRISDLAELVIALKKEKASLAAQLDQKEAEVKELTRNLAELTRERNSIREKVEAILARIESIEL